MGEVLRQGDILSQPPGGFTAAADNGTQEQDDLCMLEKFGLTNKMSPNEHLYVRTYFISSFKIVFSLLPNNKLSDNIRSK